MGPRASKVKERVKGESLAGGVGRNQWEGLRTTRLAGKPPPSCGGGGGSAETEQWCALQVTLWLCGAHKKNSKNITRLET